LAGAVKSTAPWRHEIPWVAALRGAAPFRLVAETEVRERVARALREEAVKSLSAQVAIRPWRDGVELNGRVEAIVTRLCGVSLEAFDETIDEPMHVRIVPPGSVNVPKEDDGAIVVDLEGDDPPDVMSGGAVDVAAYVVEHLALALDPFPRKPGAVFEAPAATTPASPFSVLSQLKPRGESG
jgi:uncharacterized metal-binding protein YceD (DUF177 family)